MEAVIENQSFIQGWNKTRDDIYQELQMRMDRTILDVLKNYLRENKIEFDASSTKLEDFKKDVVANLPEAQQLRLTKLEKDITRELKEMTKALHDGSQTAFSETMEKIGGFGKSVVKMVARGTAMSAAYALNPALGGTVLAGSIAVPAIVKGIKNFNEKQNDSRQASLDAFLLKLTARYDESTKQINYDIPQNIMDTVAENLKAEGIIVDSSNTTQFIRDVAGLEMDKKELAVKTINNLKGSPYDFNEEIKDLKTKIKNAREILKKDVMSPLSTAAMVGLNIGNSLATWDPDISASVVTTLATGVATGDFAVAAGAGAAQLGVSKAAQFLPDAVGDIVQNANEVETMAGATGIALGGALVLKVAPTLIKHGILAAKNFIVSKKQDKERAKALTAQEKKELGEKIDTSIKHTAQVIQGKSAREIALGIIADTLKSKGIELDGSIISKEDLKKYTQSLDKEDKKDVLEVAKALEKAEGLKEDDLKKALGGLAKTAYWGGVIALAGLGAYDAFLNPGFIEGLVVRDSQVAQQTQATFSEQLSAVKEEVTKVPQKIKNIPKTLKEIFTDPKGYIKKQRAMKKNTERMKEENGDSKDDTSLMKDSKGEGDHTKVSKNGDDLKEKPAPSAQEVAAQRVEIAEKERAEMVEEFKQTLPEENDIEKQGFMKSIPGKYDNTYIVVNESANDLIFEEFNMKTEEGLVEFFKSFGEDNPTIQKMMKDLNVKSVEELAHNEYVQESIDVLGGFNYYRNGITLHFPWKHTQFENDITRLVNQRGEEVIGTIPTQNSSNEEIEAFLDSFYENGVLDEEKQRYFALWQQANEFVSDGRRKWDAPISQFFERWFVNLKTKEEPEGVGDVLTNTLKETSENIVENSVSEHAASIPEAAENIEAAKTAEEVVAETQQGFMEGYSSKITSNPFEIAGTGAVVGAGIGAANEVKKGLFGKFKQFLKDKFGKKQKALPEAKGKTKEEEANPDGESSEDSEAKGELNTDRREAWKETEKKPDPTNLSAKTGGKEAAGEEIVEEDEEEK